MFFLQQHQQHLYNLHVTSQNNISANILCTTKGGSILVHVGTNNAEREDTTAIVRKYRQLVSRAKQTRVEQIILSGILPVMGSRGQGYRRMDIKTLVQQLCREEKVGFVDLICTRGMGFILVERVQQCLLMNYQQQSIVT